MLRPVSDLNACVTEFGQALEEKYKIDPRDADWRTANLGAVWCLDASPEASQWMEDFGFGEARIFTRRTMVWSLQDRKQFSCWPDGQQTR